MASTFKDNIKDKILKLARRKHLFSNILKHMEEAILNTEEIQSGILCCILVL